MNVKTCDKCGGSGVMVEEGFHYIVCKCKNKNNKKEDTFSKKENEELEKLRELLKIEQEVNNDLSEELKLLKKKPILMTSHSLAIPIQGKDSKEELEIVPNRPIKPRRGRKPKLENLENNE